jgi:hypothetical protein
MFSLQPQQISAAPGIVDELVAGLATQESNLWDNSFVPDIRDHLFEGVVGAGGLDLVALNIQRGRDHGVKGFFIGHLTTNFLKQYLKLITTLITSIFQVEDIKEPRILIV